LTQPVCADVVYVHGLWLNGGESLVLRRRLAREYGFRVHRFSYSTVDRATSSIAAITGQLHSFVRELGSPCVHFVGHSLGGLVIYRFLERYPRQPAGRVVFLGTPCKPSRTALLATARIRLVARLLGRSVTQELLRSRERSWAMDRDLGIIAGTQPLGVGRLLLDFDEDSDGTVAVSETRLPGAQDHIVLPVSHLGMLLSARVARETGLFLRDGRFSWRSERRFRAHLPSHPHL
jgi:pimeloyl-ACP methyl ester carboxylesterase